MPHGEPPGPGRRQEVAGSQTRGGPGKDGRPEGAVGEGPVLVFDIEDTAEIAEKLHELYLCYEEGADSKALTADGLGLLLHELHARTMEWLAGEDALPRHWPGNTFIEMLGKYANGKLIGNREAA